MSSTAALVDRIRDLAVDAGARANYDDLLIIRTAVNPVAREIAALALSETNSGTISTVAGTREYSLPGAVVPFLKAVSVSYGTTRKPLQYQDHGDLSISYNATASGEPEYWTIWNNRIELVPTPDTSSIEVQISAYGGVTPASEQPVASSLDELGLPADVEDALVYGAAAILCAIDREPEREASYRAMYAQRIRQLRTKLSPDYGLPASIEDRYVDDAYFLQII